MHALTPTQQRTHVPSQILRGVAVSCAVAAGFGKPAAAESRDTDRRVKRMDVTDSRGGTRFGSWDRDFGNPWGGGPV